MFRFINANLDAAMRYLSNKGYIRVKQQNHLGRISGHRRKQAYLIEIRVLEESVYFQRIDYSSSAFQFSL